MSLQIWLPLTKDLRQQGLLQTPAFSLNAFTQESGGKLGQYCYTDRGIIHFTEDFLANQWSLACWVKSTSWSANNDIILCKNASESTSSQFYLSIINGTSFNLGINGGSSNGAGGYSYTFSTNTWYHVAATYNGTNYAMYINGNQVKSGTCTTTKPTGLLNLGIGCRSTNAGGTASTGNANKRLNDVRIYNHALSQMEVKELAKGLVLHYPLADVYVEATTNLSNSKLSSSCYNAVTQKYSYGTNTDIYKEFGTFEGRACEKVHMGTNGLDAFPYIFFDYFQPPIGETRTLSFDYYPTIMDKVVFYTYNSPGSGNYTINYKAPVSWSGSVTIPVQLNQWNHITITVTNTGSAASGYGYMQIGNVKHTSNTANYWLFGNIQVEAKGHATGYAGPNGTRSISTVYDCSGFCNNGTKWAYDTNGIIEIAADTPKYQVSTYINSTNNTTNTASGTQYIYGDCTLTTPQYLTVAFWCKPIAGYGNSTGQGQFSLTNNNIGSDAGSDYQGGPMNHRDSIVDVNGSNGTTHKTVSINFTANEWHHYVVVYDGRYARVYKDGIATATADMGSTMTLGSMKGAVIGFSKAGGVWRSNKSYYSDFRIYATALSADDVKSLYQNCATIDPDGTIRGQIRS